MSFIKRVSEVISKREVKSWDKGSVITIDAGTGAGKSWWVKNVLYDIAKAENKKILFLIHRKNCVEQFKEELLKDGKAETILVDTYQKLETIIQYNTVAELEDIYEYIVCDEYHYWLSDSSFSRTCDISLKFIMEQGCTKILLSATADYLKLYMDNYLNIETTSYTVEKTFNIIEELTFFKEDCFMDELIKECVEYDKKAIIFIQSATKAYNLYTRHKDNCFFICSSNNKLYENVDKEKVKLMLSSNRFEENVLITTTCLDAGCNISDESIKYICVDVEDIDTMIQCLGRKRAIHKDDRIKAYIKSISNKALGGKKTQLMEKSKRADYLLKHNTYEYIKEFKRTIDTTHLIYDEVVEDNEEVCIKRVNIMMYLKITADIDRIDAMIDLGKNGFNKYVAEKLGVENYDVLEDIVNKSELELYLDSILGKRLYKEEQKELIDKIDVRVNGRQQKSAEKLNIGLKMEKLQYLITTDTDWNRTTVTGEKNIKYGKAFWVVK